MRIFVKLALLVLMIEAKYGVWPDGRPPEHPVFCATQEPLDFDAWVPLANKYDQVPLEKTELCPTDQASVMSVSTGNPTRVFIHNQASEPVNLYWVNPEGVEKHVTTLAVNQTVNEKTIEGHVFHARSIKTKELLMRHTVGMYEFTNKKKLPCPEGKFIELPSQESSPLECSHISKGFKNNVGCPINVFFWNGTHEELAGQMGTRPIPQDEEWDYTWDPRMHWEATYLTHRFYIRLANGQLVEERRVGKVPVIDCPLADGLFYKVGQQEQLTFKLILHDEIKVGSKHLKQTITSPCHSALELCHHEGNLKYIPPTSAERFSQQYLLGRHTEL